MRQPHSRTGGEVHPFSGGNLTYTTVSTVPHMKPGIGLKKRKRGETYQQANQEKLSHCQEVKQPTDKTQCGNSLKDFTAAVGPLPMDLTEKVHSVNQPTGALSPAMDAAFRQRTLRLAQTPQGRRAEQKWPGNPAQEGSVGVWPWHRQWDWYPLRTRASVETTWNLAATSSAPSDAGR